jgi:hypothetical protein
MPNNHVLAEQNSNIVVARRLLACLSIHKLLKFDYLVVVRFLGNPDMKKMNMKSMSSI